MTVRGKHYNKDIFDCTPTVAPSENPQSYSTVSSETQDIPSTPLSKKRSYGKEMIYNKVCVGSQIIHKSDYTMFLEGSVVISSSYRKI